MVDEVKDKKAVTGPDQTETKSEPPAAGGLAGLSSTPMSGRSARRHGKGAGNRRPSSLLPSGGAGIGNSLPGLSEDMVPGGFEEGLTRKLRLPGSEREVTFTLRALTPSSASVWQGNPRNRELLRINAPEVQVLRRSLLNERQREPVVAREVDQGIEVIEGRRRHFVSSDIEKSSDPTFKLWAWVGDISDQEALRICIGYHQQREDHSEYEEALLIQSLENGDFSEPMTQEEIQSVLSMTRATFFRRKKMLAVPVEIVKLLASPKQITPAGVKKLVALKEESEFVGTWAGIAEELEGRVIDGEDVLFKEVSKVVYPDGKSEEGPAPAKISGSFGVFSAGRYKLKVERGRKPGVVRFELQDLDSGANLDRVREAIQAELEGTTE